MYCACDADNINAFRYRNACFHSTINALTAETINLYAFAIGSSNLYSSAFGNYIDSVCLNAINATNAFCYYIKVFPILCILVIIKTSTMNE